MRQMIGSIAINKKFPLLENLFFLCCLFPFCSPWPISTDVQPLAGMFGALIILKKRDLNSLDIAMLIIGILSIFYTFSWTALTQIITSSHLMLLYGIVVFIACRKCILDFSPHIFNVSVILFFILSVFSLFYPNVSVAFMGHIVREVIYHPAIAARGSSGVPILSTEAGLEAGLLVGYLLLNDYFSNHKLISNRTYLLNIAMVLCSIILTKSGTGAAYGMCYIFANTCKLRHIRITVVLIVALLCISSFILFYHQIISSRSFYVFHRFFSGKILQDSSVTFRLNCYIVGLKSIFYFPFGSGLSHHLSATSHIIVDNPSLLSFFLVDYAAAFDANQFMVDSSFTNLIIIYGIFGYLFLFFSYFKVSSSPTVYKIFSFIFLSFSYSAAFPFIWLLLSLPKNKDAREDNV